MQPMPAEVTQQTTTENDPTVPQNRQEDASDSGHAKPNGQTTASDVSRNLEPEDAKKSDLADSVGTTDSQSDPKTFSHTKATRQLQSAESKFKDGNLSEAYDEAMQVWQAGQTSGTTSAEWAAICRQAENMMREIDAHTTSGINDKPLVITGK